MPTAEAAQLAEAARLRWLGLGCLLVTLVLGVAKVQYQRANPPRWQRWNHYEGFIAIDEFAERSAALRAWLTGADPGGAELAQELRKDLHPTSLAVPAIVAVLALPLGSIPWAFVAASSAFFALEVWLAVLLARRLAPSAAEARRNGAVAGILVAAHCLSARTAAQLQLDNACAALALASVLAADAWCRRPGIARALGLLALLVAALFTKTSCLPVLVAPAAAAWLYHAPGARRRRALCVGLALAAAAVLVALAYLRWLGGVSRGANDMQHLFASWVWRRDQLLRFALEMALLFQLFPLVPILHRGVLSGPLARLVALTLASFLLATWAFHLPAVPRLYLPALALGAPLCAAGAAQLLGPELRTRALGAYAFANYAVAVIGLLVLG